MKKIFTIVSIAVILTLAGLVAYLLNRPAAPTIKPHGNVHLTDYTDNDSGQSTVVVTGVVGDYGHAMRTGTNGSTLTLELSHGTFQLNTTALTKAFTASINKTGFNQQNCSGNTSVTTAVPVVANSGTGAYKGINGTFTLTSNLDEVVTKQTNCSVSNQIAGQAIIISGWGNISF